MCPHQNMKKKPDIQLKQKSKDIQSLIVSCQSIYLPTQTKEPDSKKQVDLNQLNPLISLIFYASFIRNYAHPFEQYRIHNDYWN